MGNVTKRGRRWLGTYRTPDGRRRTRTFVTKVDAERWVAVSTSDIARGIWVDPNAGRETIRHYAERWLVERPRPLRATTEAKYRDLLDRHILPTLGALPLAKLSPARVRTWNAEHARRHPATAAGAYRLLAAIFNTAVADELVPRSPCRVVGASQEHADERPTASIAEVAAAVGACPEHFRLAILLAAWCQLRRGEVLGLQRRDVDPRRGAVSVRRSWAVRADGATVLDKPKTAAAVRTVAVPPNVLPALHGHLDRFAAPGPEGWLFPGREGHPVAPRTLDRAWATARTAIGRPDLRFHDLRHSGLTWAAATGASTAELMRRAGHKSAVTALRYQHATEDRDRALAEALGNLAAQKAVGTVPPPDRDGGAR